MSGPGTGIIPEIRAGIERVGWTETARRSGLERTQLHRAFGKNGRQCPSLATVERLLPHVGLRLAVEHAD